jgi:peptidyl-prolyl cis-trans isomerase A (cyclophilin A)
MIILTTSLGEVKIETFPTEAPVTVENFLAYVDAGFFDGTIFHRVIPDFVIQGGGFSADMRPKATRPPITNEAENGLKNLRGTLSMARTQEIHSANSQFFINLKDNPFLDHSAGNFGYAVFARVVEGMDVVDRVAQVETGTLGHHQDVPIEPVVILSARQV